MLLPQQISLQEIQRQIGADLMLSQEKMHAIALSLNSFPDAESGAPFPCLGYTEEGNQACRVLQIILFIAERSSEIISGCVRQPGGTASENGVIAARPLGCKV